MAWPLRFPPNPSSDNILFRTLSYSRQFSYPLTLHEIWFWQIGSSFPKTRFSGWPYSASGLYFLKGQDHLVDVRKKRAVYSHNKWIVARKNIRLLSFIPTIDAIFVTGSLAMDNSPRYDDIDLLIVSRKNTLWLTRLSAVLFLSLIRARRHPRLKEHSSPRVSDKVCDNLYLDLNHLAIQPSGHGLYLAHEILQAKCVFDRGGVYRRLLDQNTWVRQHLPVAYKETLKQTNHEAMKPPKQNRLVNIFLFTINYLLFTVQYLYMRHRLTSEKIGLGYAFFHPQGPVRGRRT
jgi:hypothetical protein